MKIKFFLVLKTICLISLLSAQQPTLEEVYKFTLFGMDIPYGDSIIYKPQTSLKFIEITNNNGTEQKEENFFFLYNENSFGFSDNFGQTKTFKKFTFDDNGYILLWTENEKTTSLTYTFKKEDNSLEICASTISGLERYEKITRDDSIFTLYYWTGESFGYRVYKKIYFDEQGFPYKIDNYNTDYNPSVLSYTYLYDKSGKETQLILFYPDGSQKEEKKYRYENNKQTEILKNYSYDIPIYMDNAGHLIYWGIPDYKYYILPCDEKGNVIQTNETMNVYELPCIETPVELSDETGNAINIKKKDQQLENRWEVIVTISISIIMVALEVILIARKKNKESQ